MNNNTSIYQKLVPVNNKVHLSMRLKESVNYSFAKHCNAAVLTASEFEKASKYYPVLFVLEGNNIVPVALFGIEKKQNLFLKWNHQWDAPYIPAYIRRYPFSLASVQNEDSTDYVVCIDEQSPLVSKQGEHALFKKNGQQSLFLKEKVDFLQNYQIEYEKTLSFINTLQSLDLLEPMSANINLVNGEGISVTGFYTINKTRFKELSAQQHHDLVQSDEMKLIYEHFSSLDNFSVLIDKIAEKKLLQKPAKQVKKQKQAV